VPGAPVCIKNCNAAGVFTLNRFLCVSIMIHHPKDISQLDTTVGSIGVNMGQHPCGMFLIYTVEVGSLHKLRLESLKLVFQPLHKLLVNKL
jgi:hypothetical protein